MNDNIVGRAARSCRGLAILVGALVLACSGGSSNDGRPGNDAGVPPPVRGDSGQPGGAANLPDASSPTVPEGGTAGGPPVSDAGPAGTLELLETVPAAAAANVWVGAPIRVSFSQPIADGSSETVELALEVNGSPVENTLSVSGDGTALVGEITLPPTFNLPGEVSAVLRGEVVGVAGEVLSVDHSWSFQLPLWQEPTTASPEPPSLSGDTQVAVATDPLGRSLAAWVDESSGAVIVARSEDLPGGPSWLRVGEPIEAPGATNLSLTTRPPNDVVIAFEVLGSATLAAHLFDGSEWTELAVPTPASASDAGAPVPALPKLRYSGELLELAYLRDAGSVALANLGDAAASRPEEWRPSGTTISEFDWTSGVNGPVIAARVQREATAEAVVVQWSVDSGAWVQLGPALTSGGEAAAGRVSVATSEAGAIYASWAERDAYSAKRYVARFDAEQAAWVALGDAVNVSMRASADDGQLLIGSSGEPTLGWAETLGENSSVYASRWTGTRWQSLGGVLNPTRARIEGALALARNQRGQPYFAWRSGSSLILQRYNESREAPFAVTERLASDCNIPPDSDPLFPTTLEATGCYRDVAKQEIAVGLIPYAVNTELWSDNAVKRRFLYVPPGEVIPYTPDEWWRVPVGTILVKEFWVEERFGEPASQRPMETRFLVKRCKSGGCRFSWQGYSYRWNAEGTSAELLDNEEALEQDWPTSDGVLRHTYPARKQCTDCHVHALGGTIGLQALQMNRAYDFGQGMDNQLRTLAGLGLFGDSFTVEDVEAAPSLPRSTDPRLPAETRSRAYLHANCSHCHRPDGRRPEINFRFNAPLVAADDPGSNICNLIVPGSAETSDLFRKAAMRLPDLPADVKGDPMPPLASLVPDERALSLFKTWIDETESCP